MAGNVVTTQVLVDGPRNVVVKFEGVLDTADVAQTGTVGASGFTTTTGLKTIAFVAGALVPTLGQYLTFGDTAATFVAGTYVTGITDATHITVSNAALKDNAAAAVTITGTAGAIVVVDPATLDYLVDSTKTRCSKLRIDKIIHNVEDLLSVNLFWEATANVRIEELVGRGKGDYFRFGGLQNNAGAGITGKIVATTEGWTSGIKSFSIILQLVKQ
jgi:hypothetical protein